jgi:7TM diverse intracellular signalling
MQRLMFIAGILVIGMGKLFAQDTILLKEQPQWKSGMPIFEYCSFYEEKSDNPLDFNAIKKQVFVPYTDSLRQFRTSNRPLIIQWLHFSIKNLSATDTILLNLNIGAHYFVRLYDSNGLIAKSGVYETGAAGYDKAALPILLSPNSNNSFWVRTEDRQGQLTPAWVSLETDATFSVLNLSGARRDRLLFLLLAMLTGCLFFIAIFAFYQYLLYKDKAFLWYVAYTTTAAFVGLFWIDIRHGFGLFSSFFHDLIFSVFLFIVPVLYSLFIGKMLKLPDQFKKGWFIVKILMIVALLQMLIEFTTIRTGRFLFTDYYGYFVSIVPVAILNIVLLVLTALSREKVKWFMFGGLLSMLLLWCLPMLLFPAMDFKMDAITMVLIFLPFYFLLGLTIEAVIFSFALSYRSKIVLVEKNNLQKKYT